MSPFMLRMVIIFVLIFISTTLRFFFEGRSFNDKIEKPSKFQRFFLGVQVFLTGLMGFGTVISVMMQDTEMTIVSFVIFVIFAAILFGIRRKFKRFYEEREDSFWLKEQYMVDRVYYDNITDWKPLRKRIGVLDPTQRDDMYVVVNFAFHDPEILLKKLTEMTFSGKFKRKEGKPSDDPYREQEFIDHLEKNGYGSIIKEFLQEKANLTRDASEKEA